MTNLLFITGGIYRENSNSFGRLILLRKGDPSRVQTNWQAYDAFT